MMRVKNHHTPPTIRPDNDLGERNKEGGGRTLQGQCGRIRGVQRMDEIKIRGTEGEPGKWLLEEEVKIRGKEERRTERQKTVGQCLKIQCETIKSEWNMTVSVTRISATTRWSSDNTQPQPQLYLPLISADCLIKKNSPMPVLAGSEKAPVGSPCHPSPPPPPPLHLSFFLFIGGMKKSCRSPGRHVAAAALFFSCLFAQGRRIACCSGAAQGREENLKA